MTGGPTWRWRTKARTRSRCCWANGNGTFGTRTDFAIGGRPRSLAIADLNADGRPDLAVAPYLSGVVSVLLGNGDGTFGTKTDFRTGINPTAVAIADLNDDGRLDIAVTNLYSYTISVLLGNGDGTFGTKTDFGTGSYHYSVAIADLNADGRPDLAVANYPSNTVSVLLNMGAIATPTTLAFVDAHATADRVDLRWFGAAMTGVTATVYRQPAGSVWVAIAIIAGDGSGMFSFQDLNVQPGVRYGYRLGIPAGGVEKFYGEALVNVPALALQLDGLRPNPANGEPVVSFTLANGTPARLEVLDVAGRVWLAREMGDLGAGSHLVHLGGAIPPGMYWLRLTQGNRSLLARGVVVR